MTAVFKLNGVELPDGAVLMAGGNTRLPGGVEGLPSSAWYGEPMTAGIIIDDPEGVIDVPMWSTFTVDETDDVGKERIFTGWVRDRRISRGPSYKEGPARLIDIVITDIQAAFSFDCFRANSAQRPAETDVERVTFGLGSYPMGHTPVVDNGRFSTANPLDLSAADFVPQYPVELFQSTAGQCNKNFYGYWDDTQAEISFHYDAVGAGPDAGIAISNVIADVDNSTTFYPMLDAEETRDPDGVYTDILFKYASGAVVGVNQTLVDELSPTEFSPVEFRRTLVITSDRVGKLSTANAQLALNLAIHSVEEVTITVTVRLPASKVNEARAGDIISCRFTHIPGFETATDVAIIRRNVVPVSGRTDMYDVHLELANFGIQRSPGGDPNPFPEQDVCDIADVTVVQSAHASVVDDGGFVIHGASWPSPPTPGNLLIAAWLAKGISNDDPGVMDGWTTSADFVEHTNFSTGGSSAALAIYYKIAGASEPTTPEATSSGYAASGISDNNMYLIEVAGVDVFDTSVHAQDTVPGADNNTPGVPITPTSGKIAFLITFQVHHLNTTSSPDAGTTELYDEGNLTDAANPGRWIGYRIVDGTTGSYSVNCTVGGGAEVGWGSVTMAFYCSGGSDVLPPGVTTIIRDEFVADGDGTTTTFNTAHPYIPGTLKVYVDGVPIINGLTETDPTTGEFSLDFAPLGVVGDARAEIVTADYLVGYPA